MARRLVDPPYLAFPLRIAGDGPETADRGGHVRQQIEQVLFTAPGERLYRPEFGAGLRALVFEPNNTGLWELTRKRLLASLAEALRGEVDPRSLRVDVEGRDSRLYVVIRYALAAIGHEERHTFALPGGAG